MKLSVAVIAPILSALASAGMLLVLARGAEPEEVAEILAIQVAAALAFVFVELGLGREISVSIAREAAREYRFLDRLHLGIIGTVAVVAIIALSAMGAGPIAMLVVIYAAAERRIAATSSAAIASGRVSISSGILILGRAIGFTAFVVISGGFEGNVALVYAIVAAASSTFLALVMARVPKVEPGENGDRRTLRQLLSVSIHYWATTLMGQARTLDVAIVSAVLPLNTAAAYALPARALQPLRIVGTAIANLAFPLAARGRRQEVTKLLWTSLGAALAGFLALALVLPVLPTAVVGLLGEEYENSAVPLAIFALGAIINLPGAVMSSVLQAEGYQRQVTLLGVFLLSFQTAALPIAAVAIGVSGAAAIVSVTYAIQLAVVCFLYRRSSRRA